MAKRTSSIGATAWALAVASLVATGALAQGPAPQGWKAVLRIVPNPIPPGRCTGIQIEVQTPDGFRVGELSNGQALDQRRFVFTTSNTTSFSWRGDPTDGIICANAGAPPATTTIRVVLPDGIVGEVPLTMLAPGKSAPQVTYAPQAQLRPRGFTTSTIAGSAPQPSANAWKGVAHVTPNPIPAGQCALIGIDIFDAQRHKATSLSTGAPIDLHRLTYTLSDASAFQWKGGDPAQAAICAMPAAPLSHTTLSVTTQDGISDIVDVANIPKANAPPVVVATNPPPTNTTAPTSTGSSSPPQNSTTTTPPPDALGATRHPLPATMMPVPVTPLSPTMQALPARVAAAPVAKSPPSVTSGSYLITISGLQCITPTLDDILQIDGKGDEIYVGAVIRQYDRRSGVNVALLEAESLVYGDINGFTGRVQAGSRSNMGGIQGGDFFPMVPPPMAPRAFPPQLRRFPMTLFSGTLTDGVDAIVISPSIWEFDNRGTGYEDWLHAQDKASAALYLDPQVHAQASYAPRDPTSAALQEAADTYAAAMTTLTALTSRGGGAGSGSSSAGNTSLPGLFHPLVLTGNGVSSFPPAADEATALATISHIPIGLIFASLGDRAIGLAPASPSSSVLPNTVLVLTREILENVALKNNQPWALLRIDFTDTSHPQQMNGDSPAHYAMFLQVERVPASQ